MNILRAYKRVWRQRRQSNRSGQSLVEFAVMLVILTILMMGVLDIGRAYFTWLAMLDAAGEGAQFGSVYPTQWCGSATDCPGYDSADPNNIEFRVKDSAPVGTLVNWDAATVDIAVEGPAPIKPGRKITVTVTADYQIVTPFIGTIVGDQIMPLSAEAVAVVLVP